MKISTITLIWTDDFSRSHLHLLPMLKERGFDGVEIVSFQVAGFPAAEVRRLAEENALEVSFCTAFTGQLGFVSDDASIRRQAAAHIRDCIRVTAEMGAKLFCGPFYAPLGYLPGRRRTLEEWKRVVEAFQAAGEVAAQHDVTLGVEPLNRYESYFLNTVADALALCREVNHPNVGVLFDAYHANIEEKNLPDAVRMLGGRLKNVHASENDRGIPGSGHIDWPGIIQALREIGYDGFLVIESFGFTIEAIAAATCIWRDLAPTPEAIPLEGLKYFRRLLA